MPSNIPDVSSESTPRTVYHISHIKSRDVNKLKGNDINLSELRSKSQVQEMQKTK